MFKLFHKKDSKKQVTEDVYTEPIPNYAKPIDDENAAKLLDIIQHPNDDEVPIWNLRTGQVSTAKPGTDTYGLFLVRPSIWNPKFVHTGVKFDKYEHTAKLIYLAQQKRLQALADLYDIPDEIDLNRLGNQIKLGVFLPDEIPTDLLMGILNGSLLTEDYDLFWNVTRRFTDSQFDVYLKNIEVANFDAIGYYVNILLGVKNPFLASRAMKLASRFTEITGDFINDVDAGLVISFMHKLEENDAFDDGRGYNLGELNRLNGLLTNKTFQISDYTINALDSTYGYDAANDIIVDAKVKFMEHIDSSTVSDKTRI